MINYTAMLTEFQTLLVMAILFGLALGSFCGCMSYRIAHEWALFKPAGSHCPSCKKALKWYENIPLLSYLLQGGKCRKCKTKLSLLYPLAESSMAIWSGLMFWEYGLSIEYGMFMVIGTLLLLIALVDLEAFFIPDLFVTVGAIVTAGASVMGIGVPIKSAAIAGLGGALLFQGLRFAYQKVRHEEGMGYGDVKLMLFLGLCSGLQGIGYVLLISALLAFVCTILVHWRSVDKDTRLPFGPYLCAACALYMLSGHGTLMFIGQSVDQMINYVFNLF